MWDAAYRWKNNKRAGTRGGPPRDRGAVGAPGPAGLTEGVRRQAPRDAM